MASISKKGDRKYLVRVSKGTGKGREYDNRVFRGTLADARKLANKMESEMDGGLRKQSSLRFEDYLPLWLAAVKPKLAPRTLDGYDGYITRYALGPLGKLKLAEIRNFHIQQIYLSIGKAPGTVRQLHASLNACFSWAIRREYIRQNPCKNTDLPRRDKTEIEVMTPSEAFTFTELCRTMPNGLIFEFALETGMRPEEYLALRWKDINDDQVAVQQAVQFNRKGGGYYFKDLKTQQSRRLVPITDELRRSLHRHRIEQNVHRLAMKGTWFDHDLVFANEIGRPYAINNLTRRYLAPILDKCDFDKHIKLYSLRHTCATLLMLGGTNAKIVATRLGHASVTMTLETYSHVLPSMQADATELMNTMMRKKAV